MLVMSKGALSVGQAETYYQEKYSEDDYYTESHRVTGEWYGRGAETLGLSGVVSEEDFRAVLRGTRPGTGEVLVSAATADRNGSPPPTSSPLASTTLPHDHRRPVQEMATARTLICIRTS